MFTASQLQLVSVGVDYLTVVGHSTESIDQMREIAFALMEVEISEGMFSRPLGFAGYEGFQVGSVYYGERADGCIVRVGGNLAAAHYQRLLKVSDNVTRIDLQSTCRLEGNVSRFIRGLFTTHKNYSNKFKRAPKPSLFIGRDESCTMYSGSRQSDRYGRIYDKGLESGLSQFQNCVRFEVEFKGKRARRLAYSLGQRVIKFSELSASVWSFFSNRGVLIKFRSVFSNSREILISSLSRARTPDCARVLEWLQRSVRPSVSRLLHGGLLGSVRFALGLSVGTEQGAQVCAFP